MRAGALRHSVALQSATETLATSGQSTESWSTYATVWARVSPTKSGERVLGDQTIAARTHTIEIRYNWTVTTKHRILWDSRYFYILSIVDPDERGISLLLECEERL